MAMKFVKQSNFVKQLGLGRQVNTVRQITIAISAICLISVSGCATVSSSGKSTLSQSGSSNTASNLRQDKIVAQQVDSSQFLPKLTINEVDSQLIPYQAVINPYLLQKGKIEPVLIAQFIEARQAYQGNELNRAKQILQEMLKSSKNLSGPLVLLGDIERQHGNFAEATKQYQQALLINKYNVNAYIRLARVQRQQGEFIQAQNVYVKALSIWRDFPEAHLNLAILYDMYLNKEIEAQRHLEAYQFLTRGKDKKRAGWLSEIQQRTGKSVLLEVENIKAMSKMSSL